MSSQPGMVSPQPNVFNALNVKWSWLMALGVIMLILGSLAIIFPAATSVSVSLFLGILLLVGGAGRVIHVFTSRGWGILLQAVVAVIFLAAGVLLVVRPVEATLTLTLLLGIFFVAQGIMNLIMSFAQHGQSGWGWLLFNGLVSFALGVLIWGGWPSSSAWAIGLLLGVYLIFDGWALIMISWAIHNQNQRLERA